MRSFACSMLALPFLLCAVRCLAADPVLVSDGPRAVLNLDGAWEVLPNQGLEFHSPPAAEGWKTEAVPQPASPSINTIRGPYMPAIDDLVNKDGSGFKQTEKIAAWYRRRFSFAAADLAGRRAYLVFHGAAFRSTAWLNGKELGTSVQCAVPFEYDVTATLKPGENEVLVGLTGREGITDVKNRCYVTPCNGMMAGLWGSVTLELRPAVAVEDVFVRTSVKNKRLEMDVTVRNSGAESQTVRPAAVVVDGDGVPQCTLDGDPLTVAPGQAQTVTLTKDWIAPRLWSPETPLLYFARTSLITGDTTMDRTTTRFGFREFEIRGKDFFLNGVRTVLVRNSMLTALGAEFQQGFHNVRGDVGHPFNCVRLHIGQDNTDLLDACDQFGMMAVPESSFSWVDDYPSEKKQAWLANTKEYYRRWIRLHRNRPAVIMWSMCNETYWDNRRPEDMAVADELLAVVRENDPTRPQQGDGESSWDGRLPVINIHYPEGEAGDIRREFPNSGIVVPNDLWWLKTDGLNQGWRAGFKWDRPLVMGEYWDRSGGPEGQSSYIGDSVFDWEQWRFPSSPREVGETDYVATVQKSTDYYRMMGVAGLNPWYGNRELFLRPVDVRPIDYYPNWFSGETAVRKAVVLNDSQSDYYELHLQCWLRIGDQTVWTGKVNCGVPPGTSKTYDVRVSCPSVAAVTPARLVVSLLYWAGGGYHELSRFEETLYVMPKASLAGLDASGVVLLDSTGRTQKALSSMGLDLPTAKGLTTDSLTKARLVIIGEDTDCSPYAETLRSFAADGGRVVVLRQENWRPPSPELPEADPDHAASMAWVRAPDHPVIAGLSEAQMRWWRPDHLVCKRTFHKPTTGRFRILLDCGGRYGMEWTPLSEVFAGKGMYLVTQLSLVDRMEVEPMAAELLGRMIRYALANTPATPRALRLLAGTNEALKKTLAACSVVTKEGMQRDGPVLLDGSQELTAQDMASLHGVLDAGGTLWLHRFTPDTIRKVAELFPFAPQLAAFDKTIQAGALRPINPVVAGLGSFDLYWTRVDTGSRLDIFQDGQPTAKLGEYVLQLPSIEAGQELVSPALLVRVPVGKGAIFFDNLWWEDAFGAESGKVSRIVSTLVTSLGGDVKIEAEPEYAYFHVDLRPYVNMGYYDPLAGDGKGGWTDQGTNDMRFFLINHTGRAGGIEGAPEVATEPWPEMARLGGRPFWLVDPTKGEHKGVITLRGGDHCPTLPGAVKGIRVGQRADRLWFLHAACWAIADKEHTEIGRYVIHYQDGTTATMPLRYGLELQDWWNPGPLPRSTVAWTGKNLMTSPIGIYMTPWDNPNPEQRIDTIDLVGNLTSTQIVLLGITGGVAQGAQAERVLSRWSLSEAAGGSVPNAVADGPALQLSKNAPAAFSEEGHAGLHFSGGQSLSGNPRGIPAFRVQEPFSLEMTIAVDKPPVGYMGGLFQCMQYMKSGFRLVYYQNMKLGVEIFPGGDKGAYVSGQTALQPGRFYRVRLQFDGKHAQLYLNGKLDGSVETPPPAAGARELQIGSASGKDYNLEGAIEEIVIRAPAVP